MEAFETAKPPNLVIEVEATHFDGDKPSRYSAPSVREMWRVSRKGDGRTVEVEILDLQAPGGPLLVAESLALPGLDAALLPEAFNLARRGRHEALEALLAAELAPAVAAPRVPDDISS